jgi:hypothetical protein
MQRPQKIREADYDVIVVGGGMTGLCASIASARQGAKTALIQDRSVYGGNASSEIRMHICGASANYTKANLEETGILMELLLENQYYNDFHNFSIWDAVLWNAVRRQNNLTGYLNTAMFSVETEDNSVKHILCYQSSTETQWNLSARIFIDCSGNGTLSYLAGAEYRTGSEGKAEFGEPHAPDEPNLNRMGNTLLFKAIDRGKPVIFNTPEWAWRFTEENLKYRNHGNVKAAYEIPPDPGNDDFIKNNAITISSARDFDAYGLDYGYWWIELPGEEEDIIDEAEKIRDDLVGVVYGIWDHLKNGGEHGAANYDLLWVGMIPGMRESRRIVGDYIINENDLISNRIFEDAVAYGGWPVDNHTAKGLLDFDKLPNFLFKFDGAYTIPFRSYCVKNLNNLMIGGRALSASKLAMSSTRVMGTCAVGGQAMGTAAGMCIKQGINLRELSGNAKELQQQLIKNDCYIPGFINTDKKDLAPKALIKAGSFLPEREPEKVINGKTRNGGNEINHWESNGIDKSGENIILEFPEVQSVSQVRLTFDTNLSQPIRITLSAKRIIQQRPGPPEELVSDYTVSLWLDEKKVNEKVIKKNHQRLNVLDFETTRCNKIVVSCFATYGIKNIRIFEIRVYP